MGHIHIKNKLFSINSELEWHPFNSKSFKLSGNFSYKYGVGNRNSNLPKYDIGFNNRKHNALMFRSRFKKRRTFQLLATYKKSIKKNNISFIAGYSTEEFENRVRKMGGEDFFSNELRKISSGTQQKIRVSNRLGEWGLRSYFGRISYDYGQRYYVEVSLRSDGSSKFPKGNKYSYFPGVAVAWQLSNEKFWGGLSSIISNFKIRYSYGKTGSNSGIGNYSYIPQLVVGQNYGFGGPGGEHVINTVIQRRLTSENLSWEKVVQNDIGLDMGFLNNKLTASIDVYKKITNDILLNVPIPWTIGLRANKTNAGKVSNKGWELSVRWRSDINKFRYSIDVGWARNVDRLTDYAGLGITQIKKGYYRWEGSPLFAIRGYKVLGIFQTDAEAKKSPHIPAWDDVISAGDYRYEDLNGDGVIDFSHDSQLLGDMTPKHTFHLGLSFNWRGFDMSMLWNGAADVQTFLSGPLAEAGAWNSNVLPAFEVHNFWKETGDTDVFFSEPVFRQSANFATNSRNNVLDAGYIRLKSLVLGYTLPQTVLDKLELSKVRIFIGGTNLLTFSKMSRRWGLDPEGPSLNTEATGHTPWARHIYTLQRKVINFGINIKF